MREIVIFGVGQIPVRESWDFSIRELAGEAIFAAMADAGCETADGLFVGNMLSGQISRQESLGSLISDWVGLRHVEAFKLEAACGSGAAAVRMAIMAVAAGELDCAIVVGVEKMTETTSEITGAALATAADADYETIHGLSFVGINALIMQRYMHEYGWSHKDFAPFSINAHFNALHNPNARIKKSIDQKAYDKAKMIAEPINLLDASPIGDGAAAIMIASADMVKYYQGKSGSTRPMIKIAASAASTDTLAVHDRSNPLQLSAAFQSAKKAYSQASIGPSSIDVFELHDAFSIMSVLSLEACGFADFGQGIILGLENQIIRTGKIPISTFGGLKARGHPVGATGVYQIVEVVNQLRGDGKECQIDGAKVGMAQNIGGSGATVITHILTKN